MGQGGMDVAVIGVLVFSLDGENRDLIVKGKACGHVVLGAQGIGGTKADVGAPRFEGPRQGGRLGGDVQARSYPQPLEGFLRCKSFLDGTQHRHRLGRPFDPQFSLVRQSLVLDVEIHETSSINIGRPPPAESGGIRSPAVRPSVSCRFRNSGKLR